MLATLSAEAPRFFTYWNLVFLATALGNTLVMVAVGCGLGVVAGLGLAVLRAKRIVRFAPLRWAAILIVEVFRRIPVLVLLMFVFFTFQLLGLNVRALFVGALAILLRSASLFAENFRAGLESVHPNQWDAAEVMNLGPLATLRRTVLPQAWPVILPPLTIGLVGMVKATSLASQISVLELTFAARQLNQRGFSALIAFGTILVLYFLLSFAIARLGAFAERRLVPQHRRA
jgi:polar amino acid transport system permease protein